MSKSSRKHNMKKLTEFTTAELNEQYKALMSGSNKYTRSKKRAIRDVLQMRKEAERLINPWGN